MNLYRRYVIPTHISLLAVVFKIMRGPMRGQIEKSRVASGASLSALVLPLWSENVAYHSQDILSFTLIRSAAS